MDSIIRWINHKGAKILVNDYHGLQGQNLINNIDACVHFVIKSKEKEIFLLINVEKTEVSVESQLKFASGAKQIKGHCKKIAVIGLTPVKRNIVNAINKITGLGARGFDTEIKARNWLVKKE